MSKGKPKNGKDRFAKIYREFTRVKFNKYKLQFPRIRESEIIAKIIKEWQAMDQNAKEDLAQHYIQKSGRGFLQDLSSSEKKEREQTSQKKGEPMSSSARQAKQLPLTKTIKKKKKISPKLRVFTEKEKEKEIKESDDFKRSQNSKSPGKKSTPEKPSTSSSRLAIQKSKSKFLSLGIKKHRSQQYFTFYKYYHDRLRVEHPRWNTDQIGTIVKLLWRKRLKGEKMEKRISTRSLTGRQLYNRTKQSQGFLRQQIKQLWKALPYQSKKYWQIKGQGRPYISKKDSGRFVRKMLNLGAQKQPSITGDSNLTFNWLNQPII